MNAQTVRPLDPAHTGSSRLKRWVFARHSNPMSAWSRWASIPLVVLPFWKRDAGAATAVAAWMLLNPIVFPKPRHEQAWATKAMLGEELWSERLRFDTAFSVNAASTAAMAASIAGAWRKSARLTIPAAAAQMTLTLVFWKLMVDFHETTGSAGRSAP